MSVKLEQIGQTVVVHNTGDRRGAITPALYESIQTACQQAHKPEVRNIILTGGEFFCAGGDLRQLATRASLPPKERRAKVEHLHDTIRAMHHCPVPLIAAIEGGAAGAGLSLTLGCDLIICSESTQFTAAYVKAGLTPDGGLTHTLSRQLPRQMAMKACLLGQPISAETLHQHGLIAELSAKGQALSQAHKLAAQLAAGPAWTQSRIRQLLNEASDNSLAQQLDREADCMAEAQGGAEAREGISAFLQKRKPDYTTLPRDSKLS